MRVKMLKPLTQAEALKWSLTAARMRAKDAVAADLMQRVAEGDDSALIPLADRFREIGEEKAADAVHRLLVTE